jgi:hypothetical protein
MAVSMPQDREAFDLLAAKFSLQKSTGLPPSDALLSQASRQMRAAQELSRDRFTGQSVELHAAADEVCEEQLRRWSSKARGKDELKEAFDVFEHAQNTKVAATAIRAAARLSTDNPTLTGLLRKREDLNAALTRKQRRLGDLLSQPGGSDSIQIAAIRTEIEAQKEELDVLDRQVAAAVPAYARMVRPGSINLRELQTVLDADEALIDTLSLPHATYLLAINRQEAQLWGVHLSQPELAARVRDIRASLEAPRGSDATGWTGPGPFPVGSAYDLYHMIFGRARRCLGRRAI